MRYVIEESKQVSKVVLPLYRWQKNMEMYPHALRDILWKNLTMVNIQRIYEMIQYKIEITV